MAHTVSLTTAAGIAVDASIAMLTYGKAWNAQAPGSIPRLGLAAKNGASAAAQAYITGDSATGYSIALRNPPAGATVLAFDVVCLGS